MVRLGVWTRVLACALLAAGCEDESAPPPVAPSATASAAPAAPPIPRSLGAKGDTPEVRTPSPSGKGAPEGYVEVHVVAVSATAVGPAVLLGEKEDRVLPIFIGGTEALSIDLRFQGEDYKRPLTHDLYDDTVTRLGAKVVKVQVDELSDDVFFGSIHLERDGELLALDARPSDAIAIALGNDVPIFVARKVLDAAALPMAQVFSPPRAPGDPMSL